MVFRDRHLPRSRETPEAKLECYVRWISRPREVFEERTESKFAMGTANESNEDVDLERTRENCTGNKQKTAAEKQILFIRKA